ncbi:MAG: class I SAM-dependent methyltransferase [Peptococcaceae bacterium]|nr:class I SAM-dependent methyltransferase [Peptococcaceae bacterium]
MKLPSSLKALAKRAAPSLYRVHVNNYNASRPSKIREVLNDVNPPVTLQDDVFTKLQNDYNEWREPYDFDQYSTCRRAYERALEFLKHIELLRVPGQDILDLACGDGMSGPVLSAYGHNVSLLDYDDWRDRRAAHIPFIKASLANRIPHADCSFDFIFSFNAFEHVPDPALALNEALRLLRPGGHIWLDFNPLYCSPLGLHAFSFRMPYPQFLFSEEIIQRRLKEFGIHDLGRDLPELQPLNGWRCAQFRQLWNRSDCEIVLANETVDSRHLNIVLQYPQAFRGRGLTTDDLTVSGIKVVLRKR